MKKYYVVYNACFGGFSLSREAVLLGRKLSHNPKWCEGSLKGDTITEVNGNVWKCEHDFGHLPYDKNEPGYIFRHNPVLVKVVQTLKEKASGSYADLKVMELTTNKYRITEYDGREDVEVPTDLEDVWTIIPDRCSIKI